MKAFLLVAAVAQMAGCAAVQHHSYNSQALGIGDWRALEIGGRTVAPAEMRKRPWLHFALDSARVAGNAGCNTIMGPVTIEGTSLKFGTMATTQMACVDPYVAEQEHWFTQALDETDRFTITGDTLILYGGSDVKAKFGR